MFRRNLSIARAEISLGEDLSGLFGDAPRPRPWLWFGVLLLRIRCVRVSVSHSGHGATQINQQQSCSREGQEEPVRKPETR